MKVNKHFDSFRIVLLPPLKERNYPLQLWKEMKGINLFLTIPIPIEVISLHPSAIVPRENAVNIEQRYQDPTNLILGLHESIDKPFHYPRSHTLSWMLSSHHYNQGPITYMFIYQKGLYAVTQNSL